MDYIRISLEDLLVWLKSNLNEERYQHSLGTADCAKSLAEKFGQDARKAYFDKVAALLEGADRYMVRYVLTRSPVSRPCYARHGGIP